MYFYGIFMKYLLVTPILTQGGVWRLGHADDARQFQRWWGPTGTYLFRKDCTGRAWPSTYSPAVNISDGSHYPVAPTGWLGTLEGDTRWRALERGKRVGEFPQRTEWRFVFCSIDSMSVAEMREGLGSTSWTITLSAVVAGWGFGSFIRSSPEEKD